ncbi:MAG TPA: BTAD domain-containing putative transcriptional regulator, partial [Gemmatimonadales bacterium]|nr:BTAD domain-containing putative transcriptional regulator [Gemmatimonadales bacterium]
MLRLHVFGGLRLEDAEGRAATAVRRRSLALLAIVAAAGHRGITRERLLGLLWPDRPEEQGRHALAQALYSLRRELGGADPFEAGGPTLRLDPSVIAADVSDFLEALDHGDRSRALGAYAGPLLAGFYLPQADEFERWVEEERARFAVLYRTALESEAEALEKSGDPGAATRRWRELTLLEPLAAAPRLRLMRALDAAGERPAAIEEARLHREALARELGVGPDAAVARLEEALRAAAPASEPARPPATIPPAPPPAPGAPARPKREGVPRRALLPLLVLAAVVLAALLARREARRAPVVAVGVVESHLAGDSTGLARSLGDLIATHLVQVSGLRVVGRARLLEVLGDAADRPGPGVLARAARAAGADELVEGVLYRDPAGYRLDLRRTRLADGEV